MRITSQRPFKATHGFTVVELLIVIIIIGILITVSFIAYNGVQNNARDKSVQSDIDGVDGELTRYGLNNAGNYGTAVAWYSGGAANSNINFTPTAGNVIDVVTNRMSYCIRGYNPSGTKNSITNAYSKGSTSDACSILSPSVAAGGSGDASLLGWWKFNGDATDSSGNGDNGSPQGTVLTTGQNGQASGAYTFDSTGSDMISLPADANFTGVFTFSAWIKPSGTGLYETIIGNSSINGGPQFRIQNTQNIVLIKQNQVGFPLSTGTVAANVWTHVAVTYTASGVYTYYINGAASGTGTSLQTFTFSNYQIGRKDVNTGDAFIGDMDDVRIYGRALSSTEIAALYSGGAK